MIRTDFTTVTVPAGGELVNPVLAGKSGTTRHIKRLICDLVADAAALAFIDQDRVSLCDSALLGPDNPYIDIEVDLEPGQTLAVGYRDLAAAGHVGLTIGYQWEE